MVNTGSPPKPLLGLSQKWLFCELPHASRVGTMSRISSLDSILFPVQQHAVYVSLPNPTGELRLTVPDKKAIVNARNNRVLGIVGNAYRLVTNSQALEWANQCCRTVFPEAAPDEWKVSAVDAPATGGHCFFDLVHNSAALNFDFVSPGARPEIYGPFIRVANSYNGLRALKFDIGFYRKVCSNGLIAPRSIIQFKFSHVRRDIRDTIQFAISHAELTTLKASFNESLAALRGCKLSRSDFEPLIRKVLLLRESAHPRNEKSQEAWATLNTYITELSSRYVGLLGENAYALLNAITDFASHPPANQHVHRERHSLQRLAGSWLSEFSQLCRRPDFSADKFLAEPAKLQSQSRAA